MAIRAVIFDVGGVLVRDREEATLHRAWERRLGLEERALGDAIFDTPVGAQAMVGQATMVDVWQDMARQSARALIAGMTRLRATLPAPRTPQPIVSITGSICWAPASLPGDGDLPSRPCRTRP